jgi:peptidoglycan/LPS O-acetylase OafA/YrhL
MRGIAALVVLGNHFRNMFYPDATFLHGWQSVFLYPLVSGRESVMFFFLLSGFVLALPFFRGNNPPYFVFACRRILRIYGPYLGALALAASGCAIWHGQLGTVGRFSGAWGSDVDAHSLLQHVLFLGDYNYYRYNTAFWSLVYEMRISLVFPLLFWAAINLRTRYSLFLVLILTLAGVQMRHSQSLVTFAYAAIFLVGILVAKNRGILGGVYLKSPVWVRYLLALASIALYDQGHKIHSFGLLWHLGDLPVVIGAAGIIIVGLNSTTAKRILNANVPAFLGRISYSLYLVHGTVLFAMAAIIGGKVSHPAFFLLYFPTAIFLSWGFYVAVERPFMLWSRSVGRHKAVPGTDPVMAHGTHTRP